MTAAAAHPGPELATSLVRSVCSLGLPGATELPPTSLGDVEWRTVSARARSERIEGLLVNAVRTGQLHVSEGQLATVRELGRTRAQVDLSLERECIRVASVLDQAGVPWRLVKGPALAHLVYPDPSLRGFGDIDLLVEPSAWGLCVEALERSGSDRLVPELRAGFDERFGKDATFRSPGNAQIDVHRTLVHGPFGFWVDTAEMFSRPAATLTVGGRAIPTLGPEDTFLYACYSAALGDDPPRLAVLRDVAELAIRCRLDVGLLSSVARHWKGEAVVRRALQLVGATLGVDLRGTDAWEAFASRATSVWDRALIASYGGPGRGYTSQLAGVVALRGVRTKAAYLAALAVPQGSYLRARGYSPAGFLRHATRRVWGRA